MGAEAGWLEYVLNTPSHHRVHHARSRLCRQELRGVLIVFDRLFGTFAANGTTCRAATAGDALVSHNRSDWPSMSG